MATLAEIMSEVAVAKTRREAVAAEGERNLVFPCQHGGRIAVTRDASAPGKWRATRIDEDGEPTGHSTRNTFRDAIEAAYERGAQI